MGVLTDYFRAADADAVVRALERTDGGSPVGGEGFAFDGFQGKGLDPTVVLARLVAAIERVPWSTDLVGEVPVWPTTPAPGREDPVEEDNPWATGPWVVQLGARARDALAAVPDDDVLRLAGEWATAEELDGTSAENLRPVADDLIGLARRAKDADERLYCWMCL